MSMRLRGEDTQLTMVAGGEVQDVMTDVRDAEIEGMLELLREQYLGQSTEQKDEIFKGTKGRFSAHVETAKFLEFQQSLYDRAQRRNPGFQVNLKTTLRFPTGERIRILVKDLFFGSSPMKISKRDEYVEFSTEFETGNRPLLI
jgi:hypothetical protein